MSGRNPALTADAATLKTVVGLGIIQATTKECAAFFRVSEPTFLKFLRDNPEAREELEQGKGEGKISLRRKQFRLADKNAAMAIFLGKQYLDQKDHLAHQHSGPNGAPIEYSNLTPDERRARIAELQEKMLAADGHGGTGASGAIGVGGEGG